MTMYGKPQDQAALQRYRKMPGAQTLTWTPPGYMYNGYVPARHAGEPSTPNAATTSAVAPSGAGVARPSDLGDTDLPTGDLPGLVSRVETYLQDEASAAVFYRELANKVENPTVRAYLIEAMEDEQKHFRLLSRLYQHLTGCTYQVRPEPTPFTTVREGLLKAAGDEIDAYEAYKDEYQRYDDPEIRRLFFELFSDEIEHAVRFNTALHILAPGS